MLGDMLLEINSPQRALEEYESELRLNPNRFDSLSGATALAAEAAGQPKAAERYYAQLVKVCEGGNSERPELLRARSVLAANGRMGSQQSEF
jgi:tetratricopeptide (TPR) repeat protein